jgi:nucleoside-diphosphate-sugar epimerase
MRVLLIGANSMAGEAIRAGLQGRAEVLTAGRGGAEVYFDLAGDDFPQLRDTCDAAVLCAASFGADDEEGMLANARINALGTLRGTVLAARTGCRHVVYLSSIFAIEHPENGYFGSYGLSKRQGEENAALFCRVNGIKFAALRSSQLYDAAGRGRRHQPLLYRIIDCARAGEEVALYGRRDPLRNFLYVEDLAEIVARVLEREVVGVFPCVHPRSHRLSEIAGLAFRAFSQPERIRFVPEKPDIATVFIPADHSLYELIGYAPETELAAGLARIREALTS